MPSIIINGAAASTFVRAARMACIECGVDHELRSLGDSIEEIMGTLKSPAYLEKHPFAKMPSIEDGDASIFETTAIIRYISDKYGDGRLVPKDPVHAARMEQWVSAASAYILPDIGTKFLQPFVFHDEPDLAQIEADKPILRAHFEKLDHALEGRTTLAGDSVSVADLLLAPPLHYVGIVPGGIALFEGLPNLARWWENISARQSFTQTVPDMVQTLQEKAA